MTGIFLTREYATLGLHPMLPDSPMAISETILSSTGFNDLMKRNQQRRVYLIEDVAVQLSQNSAPAIYQELVNLNQPIF